MALLQRELFQVFDRACQTIEQQLNELLQTSHRSTLWVGDHWGAIGLSAIEVQEVDGWLVLKIKVPQGEIIDLEVQVSAETVLIQGTEVENVDAEECCDLPACLKQFQSLIPLPCRVYPEIISAELENGMITLTLAQLGKSYRQGVKFNLSNHCLTKSYPESVTVGS